MGKILITGVNGFIGSNIAKRLKGNYKIVGLDTGSVDLSEAVDFYVQMILPSSELEGLIKAFDPDYCIHCAGSANVGISMTSPGMDFNSGPTVVFNLMDSIRKAHSCCRVIFLSSAAVYGNPKELPIGEDHSLSPISPYGYHKLISEKILEEFKQIYDIDSVILRVFSCYGDGLRKQLLWDLATKIMSSNQLELDGTGIETRDFIHVFDLADLIDKMITLNLTEGIYNVSSGVQSRISEIAHFLVTYLSKQGVKIVYSNKNRVGDPLNWLGDISKIKNLGFQSAIDMDQGIKKYCEWFCNLKIIK
jgi:UDP-glucose 4-epimerase